MSLRQALRPHIAPSVNDLISMQPIWGINIPANAHQQSSRKDAGTSALSDVKSKCYVRRGQIHVSHFGQHQK